MLPVVYQIRNRTDGINRLVLEEDSLLSSMRFDQAYPELVTRLGIVGRF